MFSFFSNAKMQKKLSSSVSELLHKYTYNSHSNFSKENVILNNISENSANLVMFLGNEVIHTYRNRCFEN